LTGEGFLAVLQAFRAIRTLDDVERQANALGRTKLGRLRNRDDSEAATIAAAQVLHADGMRAVRFLREASELSNADRLADRIDLLGSVIVAPKSLRQGAEDAIEAAREIAFATRTVQYQRRNRVADITDAYVQSLREAPHRPLQTDEISDLRAVAAAAEAGRLDPAVKTSIDSLHSRLSSQPTSTLPHETLTNAQASYDATTRFDHLADRLHAILDIRFGGGTKGRLAERKLLDDSAWLGSNVRDLAEELRRAGEGTIAEQLDEAAAPLIQARELYGSGRTRKADDVQQAAKVFLVAVQRIRAQRSHLEAPAAREYLRDLLSTPVMSLNDRDRYNLVALARDPSSHDVWAGLAQLTEPDLDHIARKSFPSRLVTHFERGRAHIVFERDPNAVVNSMRRAFVGDPNAVTSAYWRHLGHLLDVAGPDAPLPGPTSIPGHPELREVVRTAGRGNLDSGAIAAYSVAWHTASRNMSLADLNAVDGIPDYAPLLELTGVEPTLDSLPSTVDDLPPLADLVRHFGTPGTSKNYPGYDTIDRWYPINRYITRAIAERMAPERIGDVVNQLYTKDSSSLTPTEALLLEDLIRRDPSIAPGRDATFIKWQDRARTRTYSASRALRQYGSGSRAVDMLMYLDRYLATWRAQRMTPEAALAFVRQRLGTSATKLSKQDLHLIAAIIDNVPTANIPPAPTYDGGRTIRHIMDQHATGYGHGAVDYRSQLSMYWPKWRDAMDAQGAGGA
jgi:hypothetical protein